MYNKVNREDVTARSDIEYLEAFYHQQRLHASLGIRQSLVAYEHQVKRVSASADSTKASQDQQ
jgi:hypothetical protein